MAYEITLWREVNLSTMSVQSPRAATDSGIGKLAALRLKVVKELSLDGWSELTDVGLKVRKRNNFVTHPVKVGKFGWFALHNGLIRRVNQKSIIS